MNSGFIYLLLVKDSSQLSKCLLPVERDSWINPADTFVALYNTAITNLKNQLSQLKKMRRNKKKTRKI